MSRTRHTPELTALLCMTLLAAAAPAGPVRVRGLTDGGMAFEGIVRHAEGGQLALRTGPDARPVELAIPLATIRCLSLQPPAGNREPPAGDGGRAGDPFEALPALLPLWDGPSLRLLLDMAEERAAHGDWTGAWHAAARLETVLMEPADRRRATLLKACALEELRLFPVLDAVLAELAAAVPPLEAPPRLCRLLAAKALRAGDLEEAFGWARLPALQIPAATGPLREELEALSRELEPKLHSP